MAELIVREFQEGEDATRRAIVELGTQELRKTYQPRESGGQCGCKPTGILVALNGDVLVGTAEYAKTAQSIYLQGVAVHPAHRGQGVCRALVSKAEEIAQNANVPSLALCAIEETGNVRIFEKLGFQVKRRSVAANHVSPDGGPVTQVDMEREIA